MILFTQSTAVLHKYLNDEPKILCLLQFFLPRGCTEFPEFSTFREIPEYSRFSRFVANLSRVTTSYVIYPKSKLLVAVAGPSTDQIPFPSPN